MGLNFRFRGDRLVYEVVILFQRLIEHLVELLLNPQVAMAQYG